MTSDAVTFIVNHTYRNYIFPNKIIAVDDLGLVVQKYITDVTLTFARRGGEYIVIEVKPIITEEKYNEIEQADPAPYIKMHYEDGGFEEVVESVKSHGQKPG